MFFRRALRNTTIVFCDYLDMGGWYLKLSEGYEMEYLATDI